MADQSPQSRILLVATVPSTLWAFYRHLPGVLRNTGIEVSIASSPGRELVYFSKEYGVETHAVCLTRRVSPFLDLRAVLQLVRLLRTHRYDLVHAFTPKAGLVAMIAARLVAVPHRIYSMLGLPLETARGLSRLMLRSAERATVRRADVVLAVSESLRRRVVDFGLSPAEKIKVLGHGSSCGVDTARFCRSVSTVEAGRQKRAMLGIDPDMLVFGFLGRLVPDKGIEMMVDAFVELGKTRENLCLLLVGDFEPGRGTVAVRTVREIRTHPHIRHVGFDWDSVTYYAAMDVVVLATRREGFPYALLEAASMRLPVVATRATGCVDAVTDRVTGLLVDVDDRKAMIQAMRHLADDRALRERMGRAGRERVEKFFTEDGLLHEHLRLYSGLLGLSAKRETKAERAD